VTTFLFEAANFLVMAAALSWIFFKPVRQALADRRTELASQEQQAAEKLAEAERTERAVAEARSQLQQELDAQREETLRAAQQQAEQVLADAKSAAQREWEANRRRVTRLTESQRTRLARAAAGAVAQTVGELLRQIESPELQNALLRSACQQLRTLDSLALAPVQVETAQPLSAEERARLDEALGPAAKTAEIRTSNQLQVGVRISTGDGLIDASDTGLVQYARQAFLQQLNHHAQQSSPEPLPQ
jgi:F-type H+-transporting ATPase subunit b